MSWKKTLLVSGSILLIAVAVLGLIFRTEPEAQRAGATKETAMLVDVVEVDRGTFRPTITAMGTVEPEQDVILGPRVEGQVVERSPAFTPGGFVQEGQVLLEIDPSDFRNVLAQRRSELEQAKTELQIEMGRQDVARQDLELLRETLLPRDGLWPEGNAPSEDELSPEDRALVLRQPQLDAARARVASAQAAVDQAELDLERTTIRAPFDAHVLSREVDVGSQVAPGDRLGRLVGTDAYWVEVAVPVAKLRFLTIPGERDDTVQVRNRSAWPAETYRTGRIEQLLGELAGQTRMARLLVTVPDPLARERDSEGLPPLILGSFLEAEIEAREIQDVVRLDRDYLRKDDTVWVMEGGELGIRKANVVFRDARYAYVSEGLKAGDRVVTTNLSTVVEGAPLRVGGSSEDPRDE